MANRRPLFGISSPQRACMRLIVSASELLFAPMEERGLGLPVLARAGALAILHSELGAILGWIEAQAIGKTRKRETPAAFATGVPKEWH
jgi:hypothetical protein